MGYYEGLVTPTRQLKISNLHQLVICKLLFYRLCIKLRIYRLVAK